jgi:deoxyribodipyrimidine photo-lyase
MNKIAIFWLRLDLRLADNPALRAAIRHGGAVIPAFIHGPNEEAPWQPGGASNWWLHHSLSALDKLLRERGSRLIIRRGPALESLGELAKETGATAVFWNRRYEPAVIARDAEVMASLRANGLKAESLNGGLLREPWAIKNKSGRPFQVFTPFWKHCLGLDDPAEPLPAPIKIQPPENWPASFALRELSLLSKIDWAAGMRSAWQPGEASAMKKLKRFFNRIFEDYSDFRNRPDLTGTSRLSPHLHFGEISPRQVWHAVAALAAKHRSLKRQWRNSQFLAEIGWREFAHHLLYHFPWTPDEPLRRDFEKFPWRTNQELLRSWRKGLTGYPIVDAGMRELWTTGWMHNRVRMIVASFLVKDLLLPWQSGARWFWDTLVDADLAQNTLGWQWTAGCGADAAPYFRVFNPTSQGEKFDPKGDYVRRWCPELAKLPAEYIHKPHAAPSEILRAAGVELGRNYPKPIVDHAKAREVALAAFARVKLGS